MVEKLGAMTPEQLEEIPEIGPDLVESIQAAVVSYYGQFETGEGETPASETASDAATAETPAAEAELADEKTSEAAASAEEAPQEQSDTIKVRVPAEEGQKPADEK